MVKGILAEWGICSRTVSLNGFPFSLTHWKNTIAVGFNTGNITIFDSVTGSQVAVFSGHNGQVGSLTFSLDGTFLLSGSGDETVKLWDVQTGGVVKTFCGHTHRVLSVSISPDCTTIASGSLDKTIRLWDVKTGNCFCVIGRHRQKVTSVSFSPTNSRLLISASNDYTVRQWSVNGTQIGPTCEGTNVALSWDTFCFMGGTGCYS